MDRSTKEDELFYSESNRKHLQKGIQALDEGKGVEHELIFDKPNEGTIAAILETEAENEMHGPFDSVSELMEVLDED